MASIIMGMPLALFPHKLWLPETSRNVPKQEAFFPKVPAHPIGGGKTGRKREVWEWNRARPTERKIYKLQPAP